MMLFDFNVYQMNKRFFDTQTIEKKKTLRLLKTVGVQFIYEIIFVSLTRRVRVCYRNNIYLNNIDSLAADIVFVSMYQREYIFSKYFLLFSLFQSFDTFHNKRFFFFFFYSV